MTLIPTPGTVLSMSPAEGEIELKTKEATWRIPLIGYAVVVHYVGTTDNGRWPEYEAAIEPVGLAEGTPGVISSIVEDYADNPLWRVVVTQEQYDAEHIEPSP